MAKKPLTVVREVLQSYADRGIFRAFSEVGNRGTKTQFKFLWLAEEPFILVFDEAAGTLRYRNLLPNIPTKSDMYAELKDFVKGRCSKKMLAHRRVDPKRVEVKCSNRGGDVSLTFTVKKNHYEYGTRRAIYLVNEIFLDLLTGSFYDYMVENFNASEE